MKRMSNQARKLLQACLLTVCASVLPAAVLAQTTVTEDFTGTTVNNSWTAINGACLTSGAAGSTYNGIPACVGLPYYVNKGDTYQVGGEYGFLGNSTAPSSNGAQTPDNQVASDSCYPYCGALRLTNGSPYYAESGAIISTTPFPTSSGVQITFKTITYSGDSGGTGGDGADGISFFLLDATTTDNGYYVAGSGLLGSWGGSLAYSCSNQNPPYTGQRGAYIGLGIDEYGNFLNGGQNATGGYNDNTALGVAANGWGSGNYQWNRIGLRGAGNVNWNWLTKNYPNLYPSTLSTAQQQSAVQSACETGTLWNYSVATPTNTHCTSSTSCSAAAGTGATGQTLLDYAPIPGANGVLNGVTIANEGATTRAQATPIYYVLNITGGTGAGSGLLSLSYSYGGGTLTPILSGYSITSGGTQPSLPPWLLFGFAGSTGGSDNIHEILCFQAGPADESSSSTTVNLPQDKLVTQAQVYLPSYHSNNWWGQLVAETLQVSTTNPNVLSIVGTTNSNGVFVPTINWDAACALTGTPSSTATASGSGQLISECPSTLNYSGSAEATSGTGGRQIITWNPTAGSNGTGSGEAFLWSSSDLNTAQEAALNAGDSTGSNRLSYLRGVRTDECPSTGCTTPTIYRDRTAVLGDIVHSSPVWVGSPSNPGYESTFSDKLNSNAVAAEGANSYQTFATNYAGRENVVYVGANDGMLHGFRSGVYNSSTGTIAASTYANDGLEVLAYMPGAIVNSIHSTSANYDFSSPNYSHTFGVDAAPNGDDLYYNGAWHTWLVGGLGAGGSAIYALDVTDPTGAQTATSTKAFSEGNASNIVVGEWTPSNLSCVGNTSCGAWLNNTYGTPVMWRFHATNSGTASGKNMWGMVFGNGLPNPITASLAASSAGITASIGTSIVGLVGSQFTGTVNGTSLTISTGTLPLPGTTHSPTNGIGGTYGSGNTAVPSNTVYSGTCSAIPCTVTLNNSLSTRSKSWQWSVPSTNLYVSSGASSITGPFPVAITGSGITSGTTITGTSTGTAGGGTYTVFPLNQAILVGSTNIQMAGTTMTVTAGGGLAAGQSITGSGVAGGTTIVSQISGTTGGVGAYTVSPAQFVGSETMSNGSSVLTVTAGSGLAVGQQIYGPGVPSGAKIAALATGTGGPGTYIMNTSTGVASETMAAINSGSTGTAGIYVMLVDPSSTGPSTYFYFLDTGYGPSNDPMHQNRPNGIAYATPVDLDGDNTADFVYAGDLFGNVWRFDLTSFNPSNWAAHSYSTTSTTPTPLFSTPVTSQTTGGVTTYFGQPITSRVVAVLTPQGTGNNALVVDFGTGQEYPFSPVAATTYAAGQQALYGIWDWDMTSWNSLSHMSLATLTGSYSPIQAVTTGASPTLATQTVTVSGSLETETMNTVCWKGSTICTSANSNFGWTVALPNSGEEIIYNPSVFEGVLQLNTTIPSSTSAYSCSIGLPSGFTMFINPSTGGSFTSSSFLDQNGNPMTAASGGVVTGEKTGGTGSISSITAGSSTFFLTDTSGGTAATGGFAGQSTGTGHRLTWTQLR